jgi:pilus assembly protein CpaE
MYKEQRSSSILVDDSPRSVPESSNYTSPFSVKELSETRKLSVVSLGLSPVASSTLRHMLLQSGLVKDVQEWGSAKGVELRNPQDVPDVIILDVAENGAADFAFVQQLSRLRPTVHIVACTMKREGSPEFLLQAMRAGVRDFVQKPLDRAELYSMLERVSNEHRPANSGASGTGKLFVVLGTKGGVGASTVSVNLGVQLAKIPGKTTVLLDFSRPLGDVAALLDLRPKFHLSDALENFKRLDTTMLSGLLAEHRSGLRVLAGAARLEDWKQGSAEALRRLVQIAQQSFDFVVIDFGSFYCEESQGVLQDAEILLVSEADLAGLAKLQRHLGSLANLQISATQVRLVINRWHRHDEEALQKVETGMRIPVFARLPNNFKQVNEATMRGDSLKHEGDGLSGEFHKMAELLAGAAPAKQVKKSRIAQILSF